MANDAVVNYEKLAQDAMDDLLPRPTIVCKDCANLGVPFALNAGNGPRDADLYLGIPSNDQAATEDWFTSNPWIKDQAQNFCDTYLLRVIKRLGELHDEAYLAEFYAFISAQNIEFYCLDDEMEDETYVTPRFLMEVAQGQINAPAIACGQTNFVFLSNRIYFWTFTSARYSERSVIEPHGQYNPFPNFDWSVSGQYEPTRAAQQLAHNYQRAKAAHKRWVRIKGGAEILFGVLSLIPVVGVARGAVGAYRGVTYTIAAIDAALAANAIANGSTALITGEGIDHGENLFASLGQLVDPSSGDERGRQVFMFINLAMLANTAYGGARWVLRKVRNDVPVSARLDVEAVSEAERLRLGGHTSAEPVTIELRGNKAASRNDEIGNVEWRDRPSLDTNRSQVALTTATGKANYAIMSNTLRSRLTMLIVQHAGSLKVVGRICKVVGDAGEEAFAAAMVEKMGFKAERILGYSNTPGVPSRFGLTNKSGHGLDMLVWVPPPPSLTVRAPTSNTMRHSMDGANGTSAPTQTLNFTEDTLLVIETKATLGGTKTPGFNSTQGSGSAKLQAVMAKIKSERGGWSRNKRLEADIRSEEKIKALERARLTAKISYLHAQVFFDSQGDLSKFAGSGTGIQINSW